METWKLVSGILSIVMSFLVMFQSCAAGLFNLVSSNGEASGIAGLLVAALLLAGGIVSVLTRYALNNWGNISLIILYGIAALLGYMMAGSYADLLIWSTWCLLCAVMAGMSIASDNVCDAWVYILIGIIGIGLGIVGFKLNSGDNPANTPASSKNGERKSNKENEESENGKSIGTGNVGDHHIEIKGASLAEDYEGKPAIIITYAWTNNSEDTTNAMTALMEKAFQDGVQLENAIIGDSETYEVDTTMKDIRPETTIDIQKAYVLGNVTSKVEFEVSEFLGFSDAVVTMDFDPVNLG